ncbi:MAG TPA: hypothetical protein DIS90_12245, partial [Cytophagales bacterium]|nr:hypothetical protein [Cytophagales bacterium]
TTDKVTYGDGDTDPYTISGNQITLGTGSKPETFEFSISGSTLILTSKRLPADGGCKEVTTLIRV